MDVSEILNKLLVSYAFHLPEGDARLLHIDELISSVEITEDDLSLYLGLQVEISGRLSNACYLRNIDTTIKLGEREFPVKWLFDHARIKNTRFSNLPTYLRFRAEGRRLFRGN